MYSRKYPDLSILAILRTYTCNIQVQALPWIWSGSWYARLIRFDIHGRVIPPHLSTGSAIHESWVDLSPFISPMLHGTGIFTYIFPRVHVAMFHQSIHGSWSRWVYIAIFRIVKNGWLDNHDWWVDTEWSYSDKSTKGMDNHEWLELIILANRLHGISGIKLNWEKVTLLTAAVLNHQEQSMETHVVLWKPPFKTSPKTAMNISPHFRRGFWWMLTTPPKKGTCFLGNSETKNVGGGHVLCKQVHKQCFVWHSLILPKMGSSNHKIKFSHRQTQKNNATAWCRKPQTIAHLLEPNTMF